jgi:hypothetical protein
MLQDMFIIPINFGKKHTSMLSHWKRFVEYNTGGIVFDYEV